MKKDKLLQLVKYIKEKDLIQKYNDIYKEYDEKKEIDNPGFRLSDLYSLTDEDIDLILSSKHDTEALFRLRMNSVSYNELIRLEVKEDDSIILETIEDFRAMEDYETYDVDKKIIRLIIKQDKESIVNIILFLSHMTNKNKLSICSLSILMLHYYLSRISMCKTYKSANLMAKLASSNTERKDSGLYRCSRYSDYHKKVIDKIQECDKNFQADYIEQLLKAKSNSPMSSEFLLENIPKESDRLKVIEIFTKATNEVICKIILDLLKENELNLAKKSANVLSMIEECITLKEDEDYVNICVIEDISELEEILNNIDSDIEIDRNIKVKIKKKKK